MKKIINKIYIVIAIIAWIMSLVIFLLALIKKIPWSNMSIAAIIGVIGAFFYSLTFEKEKIETDDEYLKQLTDAMDSVEELRARLIIFYIIAFAIAMICLKLGII